MNKHDFDYFVSTGSLVDLGDGEPFTLNSRCSFAGVDVKLEDSFVFNGGKWRPFAVKWNHSFFRAKKISSDGVGVEGDTWTFSKKDNEGGYNVDVSNLIFSRGDHGQLVVSGEL